ncbi:MAG: tRNA (adenosine(37)-N6)-threonylcarbamoyltransferase complex ATPase subunit type 1 TsaE [Clostridia bacterium]|nr:tRNA (adenosine(37)-N6)-threonylcarbamoyltransferase complex ATPase subunit type 1 TsaE [Clostridia bacterium]
MTQEFITRSPEETEALGRKIGALLDGDEIIALFGGLGMGKTAFVRGLAEGMGIAPREISSPTFAIVHEHEGNGKKLYHFDMYRVESWDDLYSTGFFDYIGNGVTVTEWSENIEGALPDERIDIAISAPDHDDTRIFTISGMDLSAINTNESDWKKI